MFVSHFSDILAPTTKVQYPDLSHIVPHGYVTKEDANALTRQVTIFEIEEAIKNANPNKTLGPDGFNAHFFKICGPL